MKVVETVATVETSKILEAHRFRRRSSPAGVTVVGFNFCCSHSRACVLSKSMMGKRRRF